MILLYSENTMIKLIGPEISEIYNRPMNKWHKNIALRVPAKPTNVIVLNPLQLSTIS